MTYDTLLRKVKDIPTTKVLLELHKPEKTRRFMSDSETILVCPKCSTTANRVIYPCETVQMIERELK